MIVTTASNETQSLTDKARRLSAKYQIEYYPRKKEAKSLAYMLENIDPQIFVVNNMRGVSYYERGKDEAFFHPNMAFQRIINLKKGGKDSMAEACKLEPGMSFFDGTLGLAADSLVASYIVGGITAAEKSLTMFILAKEGLKFYAEQHPEWSKIIGRINIKNIDNLDFMRKCETQSFDILYFDFMFGKPVTESDGIQVIRNLACYDKITAGHVHEAFRVAKKRVVVKSDGNGIKELLQLGFITEKEYQRKKFYYAVLSKY